MQITTKSTVYRTYDVETDNVDTAFELILDELIPYKDVIFEEDQEIHKISTLN